ncbi:formimidoyltransferase-cyclodeaminase-like [Periplaneta americana]|uniref:formimidoyltransferase-cyclodeaminase-like n=1 Tax=Periplaneta americana TaxID=6978 RepID=UPI0037E8A880
MSKIVECVPNFSEGRDQKIINAIASAVRDTDGCTLLDVDPGASTNRTVYTFVGEPPAVVRGALNAAIAASKLINMATHKGEHPRVGAMDVCPFIPVRGVTEEECVGYAKQLGHLLASELSVPVFLYGAAASRDYRRTVAQIRAGEYEALAERINDEKWAPDFGPAKFVPEWGATMVGVRKFLIAYNINLIATKEQAHRIALNVREQGRGPSEPGKLRAVQGIGWWLEEANMAQVSLNLLDHDVTPIHAAYEEVCKDALDLKLPVVGSEIVGLVPLRSLLQVAEFYIEKEGLFVLEEDQKVRLAISKLGLSSLKPFIPKERIIEYRLEGSASGLLIHLTTENFVKAVGARTSAPGGGSVAALLASLGAALGTMVGQMTYGKRQFESLDSTMRELIPIMHRAMSNFVPLIDADTAAFNQYMEALKLPKKTDEEVAARNLALQEGLKKAVEVPYNLAKEVNALWPTLIKLAGVGNMGTVSDLQVGARCLETSVWGAYHNVLINLEGLANTSVKETLRADMDDAVRVAQEGLKTVLATLEERKKK